MNGPPLRSLASVTVADVYKSGRLAATLSRESGQVEFRYVDDYLRDGGTPVATTLPLDSTPVRVASGAVPPFFAGLLPEGRRLSNLRRAVKTSADDELSLLLAIGRDTVGVVQVVPSGVTPIPAEPLVQVRRSWTEIRFSDLLEEAGVVDPVGLPGVQDKASARMISVPVARAGERYLLKISPPEYPCVVENEDFFLRQARGARIECARARVVHDAEDRPGLLVQRFDRVAEPSGDTTALACEDACQVLGRWPADKYNLSAEEVVNGLAERCAARTLAARNLFEQICFAWLTGNGDAHAKNLSILATVDGEWLAAPAYDLPSTVPYGDLSLALSLQGRTRGISRRHLVAFASDVGLPDRRVAERTIATLLRRLEGLEAAWVAAGIGFPEHVTRSLLKELRHRWRQASPGP